jgi:hypothetical protein
LKRIGRKIAQQQKDEQRTQKEEEKKAAWSARKLSKTVDTIDVDSSDDEIINLESSESEDPGMLLQHEDPIIAGLLAERVL